jgi:hypothetical protein
VFGQLMQSTVRAVQALSTMVAGHQLIIDAAMDALLNANVQ